MKAIYSMFNVHAMLRRSIWQCLVVPWCNTIRNVYDELFCADHVKSTVYGAFNCEMGLYMLYIVINLSVSIAENFSFTAVHSALKRNRRHFFLLHWYLVPSFSIDLFPMIFFSNIIFRRPLHTNFHQYVCVFFSSLKQHFLHHCLFFTSFTHL